MPAAPRQWTIAPMGVVPAAIALAQCPTQLLLPPPQDTSDRFGFRVQMNDRHLLVGDHAGDTPCGAGTCSTGVVYAYQFDEPSGEWVLTQAVYPTDVAPGDGFGRSVYLDGDRMIVGATGADLAGDDTGGAYIFEFDGEAWVETARFGSPEPHFLTAFGRDVAIEGSVALVMQYTAKGIVFVYEQVGGAWTHKETLWPPDDPFGGDSFGNAIEVIDDWLFIGAPLDRTRSGNGGAVYAYRRIGPAGFEFVQKIEAPDADEGPLFGHAIVYDDGVLAVSGYLSERTYEGQGAVYLYELDGDQWSLTHEVVGENPTGADLFGGDIGLQNGVLVVGASEYQTPSGYAAAFVFRRTPDDRWVESAMLVPESFGGSFGAHLATNGERVVVGASRTYIGGQFRGAAHGYDLGCLLCPPDLDADGALTIYDFLTFLNLFDAGDPQADFDGDGTLTLFDFLAFQTAFDAGCP